MITYLNGNKHGTDQRQKLCFFFLSLLSNLFVLLIFFIILGRPPVGKVNMNLKATGKVLVLCVQVFSIGCFLFYVIADAKGLFGDNNNSSAHKRFIICDQLSVHLLYT